MSTKLHQWMIQNHKSLALAESCTGGAMAAQITKRAGASRYFLGSLVTYSNDMKTKILGVDAQLLKKHGAVSKEVATAMLLGVFRQTGADFAIAVTGVAGPTGGTKKTPVGTVFYALGQKGRPPSVGMLSLKGSRSKIITVTTRRLFALLWKSLLVE